MLSKLFNASLKTEESFLNELLRKNFREETLLKAMSENNININYIDKEGNSFLHNCISSSNYSAATWLIDHGIDTSIENNNHQMSLHLAIKNKNEKIVRKILDKEQIDINEKDINGRILLQDLVFDGDFKMSKILIEYGADINSKDKNHRNVIFDALSYGDESFIVSLLESDNDLELNNIDSDLNTIMHHSEVAANENIAKKLIAAGADTTIKNIKGESFFCKTALEGEDSKDLVELALQNGANPNTRNNSNNTIFLELMNAFALLSVDEVQRRNNLLDMSKLVMEYGGDIDALNENNETALFQAVKIKDFDLISFLLTSGIDPNIINKNMETVLLQVVYQGIQSLDILLLLLKSNANPLIRNLKSQTIYETLNNIILYTHNKIYLNDENEIKKIDEHGQYMVVLKEILKNNKEDLNFLDTTGNPLFFQPLLNDEGQLFRLYINNGLNINTLNKSKYNIFFSYVLKVFEDNTSKIDFQNNLSRLISKKVNQNFKDSLGWTVTHKILSTKCNNSLVDILFKIVKFDLTIVDNLGRTVMHNAVWSNNQKMIKKINNIDKNIMNIADNYGLLPITYAALLGSQEMVLLFIELKINMKGGHHIPNNAIKKFSPMLKNLSKIRLDISNTLMLEKVDTLIHQTQVDFNVPESLILK